MINRDQPTAFWMLGVLLAILVGGMAILFGLRFAGAPEQSALRGWDNTFYFIWLRSVVEDGDIDFANDLALTNTLSDGAEGTGRADLGILETTSTGKVPNKYGIGWALFNLPAYLVAELICGVAGVLGIGVRCDGFGWIHQICLQFGNLLYAGLGCWICLTYWRRYLPDWAAAMGLVALLLVSPALYYLSANLSMVHHLVFLLVAWLLSASERLKEELTQRRLLEISLVVGLLLVTRYHMVIFALYPAWVIWRACRFRGHARQFAIGALPALLLAASQLVCWKLIYGSWFVNTYADQHADLFNWTQPALLKVLFHPNHGLFYWHPFLFLAAVGWLVYLFKADDGLGKWMLTMLMGALLYVNASVFSWNFGASFGHRGFVGILPILGLGFGRLLAGLPVKGIYVLWGSLVAGGLFNIHLAIVYSTGLIDRNGPVTWAEMLGAMGNLYRLLLG